MKRKRMKLLVVKDNDGGTAKLQEDALTIESVVCMDKPKTRCYLNKHHKAMTHVDCWLVTFSFLHARITTCIHHALCVATQSAKPMRIPQTTTKLLKQSIKECSR